MALKFWLGGATSDKSDKLTRYVLEEAKNNPERQYLVVVPEQICLKTQRDYVLKSENKGILNIDILPFTRFAHRIGDEVGNARAGVTTLDDMGKNLILEHLALKYKDDLKVFGDNIEKLGYIEKVKSAISEYMQYGISVEKAQEMASLAADGGRRLLASKLSDVAFLYDKFVEYIRERYTTVEETLDLTADIIHSSDTVRNSVIVFDGFTGFTPVQVKLIAKLMEYAIDIHVALLLEEDCIQNSENSPKNNTIKEHELFNLSKKTISTLEKLADERRVIIKEPYEAYKNVVCETKKFTGKIVYKDSDTLCKLNNTPVIISAGTPEEEIMMVARQIKSLIRTEGYRYDDFALITGDIERYRATVQRVFGLHGIPFFLDRSEPILMNPFMEYIRALIDVYTDNYSRESVFRYLKSGFSGFDGEEIFLLENYCIATGVKGYKKWHERFVNITDTFDEEIVLLVENIRKRVIDKIDGFSLEISDKGHITAREKHSVRDFAIALYNIIDGEGINEKLKECAAEFEECGLPEKKEEYSQIYVKIMNILDQLCDLIPDEMITVREFGNLIDAALSEVRIGILPERSDYVQMGDLTRTRLNDVSVLFIVGANDGIIPSGGGKNGIINDSDKEFMQSLDSELVLAPTVREEAYTQRLYLYMMMNSPKERLVVSYSRNGNDGKSLLPSYFVRDLKAEYPDIVILKNADDISGRIEDFEDACREIVAKLHDVICGYSDSDETSEVLKLLKTVYSDNRCDKSRLYKVLERALLENAGTNDADTIGKALAGALYGKKIIGSVTRLETYANCAYQYFLKYALKLNERETFSIEANDLGMIFHESLSEYAAMITREGLNWTEISDEEEEKLIASAVDVSIAKNHLAKLYSTARTTYLVSRVKRIMGKTAHVLKEQLRHGKFVPKYFEMDFDTFGSLECLNITLSDDEMMKLKGRIDRVDVAESDDGIYVKIIDYKSSAKSMDLMAVYEGRQLQLLTYLNAAMESERINADKAGDGKAVVPAGVLYYRIDDPIISDDGKSDEEIKKAIMKELRLKGLINSDGEIAELIDKDLAQGSEVISVSRKNDGDFKSSKQLVSGDDFGALTNYVCLKIREIGEEILSGNIKIQEPDGKKRFTKVDCTYCPYKSVCANKSGKSIDIDETETDSDTEDEKPQDSSDPKSNEEILAMMRKAEDQSGIYR